MLVSRQLIRWLTALTIVLGMVLLGSERLWAQLNYPAPDWQQVENVTTLGWSYEGLQTVEHYQKALGSTALVIVTDGKLVAAWGDTTIAFPVYGIADTVLSALYGIATGNGAIDLSQTLADLALDDYQPLTEQEKQATISHLLQGRSGVYLPATSEEWGVWRPGVPRDASKPGTAWLYNVWAINALSTIFTHKTGTEVFAAFQQWLAEPLNMQDFRPGDGALSYGPASLHPGHRFRASARDLARLGLLFLGKGQWQAKQIIPADWVVHSTRAQTSTQQLGSRSGYGYLWWVAANSATYPDLGITDGIYTASGSGGQRLVVIPNLNTVIVHLIDSGRPGSAVFTDSTFDRLLSLILDARLEREGKMMSGGGQLLTRTIPSPTLAGNLIGTAQQQPIAIYLPPSYETQSSKRYPVVYLLPHYREIMFDLLLDIEEQGKVWAVPAFNGIKLQTLLDHLIENRQIPEMIVVIPNSHNAYFGSFYTNSSVTGRWEDFIVRDLINYVDTNFRTIAAADSRGVGGHGMGGFGAIRLGMKYPEVFSAIYGLSPCCLAWEEDLTIKNPAWRRAMLLSKPLQLNQAWHRGDVYLTFFTSLAAAFSPNPEKPPLFVDWPFQVHNPDRKPEVRVRDTHHGHDHDQQPKSGELVENKAAYSLWQRQFPVNMIAQYREKLKQLNQLVLEHGTQDTPVHIAAGINSFSRMLAKNGIAHQLDVYEGAMSQSMRDRLANKVLPFFGRTLRFKTP